MKSHTSDTRKKQPYLVLVIFVLVTHVSDQTNEMGPKALNHAGDVPFRSDAGTGGEDVCGIVGSDMDQP